VSAMKSDGPLWDYQPQPSLWERIRATTLGRARWFFDVHRVGSHGEPIGVKGLVADIAARLCVFGYSPVILVFSSPPVVRLMTAPPKL
jgi:hypothetical protein